MMKNQPEYQFLKNTVYALQGLKDIIKSEKSFKIELIIFIISIPIIFLIDTALINKLALFGSLGLVLVIEAINSAIERVVDLVTLEHEELAGKAKDAGSAAVFISIIIAGITWLFILIDSFKLF